MLLKQPTAPKLVEGYAKGVLSRVEQYNTFKCRTTISDDFETDLSSWINVQGKLKISSGNIDSDGLFGYAAGIHQTPLLSDNCRAKVKMQDGFISAGKSCVFICSDKRMNFYYGLVIETGLLNNKFHIVRGTGTKSRQIMELPDGDKASYTVEIDPDNEAEIWYDQPNSVIRAYYNGSQVLAVPVDRNDIPHGPGRRYSGVVMGIDWFISPGVLFEEFSAWDVAIPGPFMQDGFDSLTVNPHWLTLDDGVMIHRHLTRPNTMGPNNALVTDAAVLWDVEASSDSVKIVVRTHNFGGGTYTIALCSNASMTNWLGVQWEMGFSNVINTVRGTGPTDYVYIGDRQWSLNESGTVFIITYNYESNTLQVHRNTEREPLLEWVGVTGVTHGPGHRYIGQVWETDLLSTGPQPSMFEAYNVTTDAPL